MLTALKKNNLESQTGINNIRSESSNRVLVSLDYLRVGGQVTHKKLNHIIEYLNEAFGDFIVNMEKPGHLGRLWGNHYKSPLGIRVFTDELEDKSLKILLDIPGTPLRKLTVRDSWRVCLALYGFDLVGRRFDAALDDYTRRISPDEIIEHCKLGNYALVRNWGVVGRGERGSEFISTVYLGSRESEKFLRFYNAEVKHGILADRWEVELKRRHAAEAFAQFCALPTGMDDEQFEQMASMYLGALVVGAVDFGVYSQEFCEKNYKNFDRLEFWQSLVDDVNGILRLSPSRTKPTLQKSLQWFKRQVSCFLEVIRQGYGHQYFYRWLDSTLKDSQSRHTPFHKAQVQALQLEMGSDFLPKIFDSKFVTFSWLKFESALFIRGMSAIELPLVDFSFHLQGLLIY